LEDMELVKTLDELENKQWASKVMSEVRTQMKDFEYKIVFKSKEDEFFGTIKEFASTGYDILPGTSLFQNETFIVLMRREKAERAK
jgi:hypothetical protein